MTSNDPTGNAGSGDPADDATRADWPIGAPQQLARAQGLPPSPGSVEPASGVPAGPPPGPSSTPPPSPPAPGYATPPAYAGGPGYVASSTPGYAPGAPGSPAPGMAWAPPPEAYGVPATGGLAYAGTLPRIIAWIVDSLILAFVTLALSVATFALFGDSTDGSAIFRGGLAGAARGPYFIASLVALLIGLGIQLLYFVLQWSSRARATIGMRLLGLQVANARDGATLTRSQGVRRWIALGAWLGLLGYVPGVAAIGWLVQLVWVLALLVTTASSATKQGLHDRVAGSVVVQPGGASSSGFFVGCMVTLALLLALPVVGFIALAAFGGQMSEILGSIGESV